MSRRASASPRRKIGFEELKETSPPDIGDVDAFIGPKESQARFFESIEFGLRMFGDECCNIFVTGLEGPSALDIVRTHVADCVKKLDSGESSPFPELSDYCYVHNFKDRRSPRLIILPRGQGKLFKSAMNNLLKMLKEDMPGVVSNDLVNVECARLADELNEQLKDSKERVIAEGEKLGFFVDFHPMEMGQAYFVPGRRFENGTLERFGDKELEEYMDNLSEAERKEFNSKRGQMAKIIGDYLQKSAVKFNEYQKKKRDFVNSRVDLFCEDVFGAFEKSFSEKCGSGSLSKISPFLKSLKTHAVTSCDIFLPKNGNGNDDYGDVFEDNPYLPWEVNIVVDNSRTEGAPIIVEREPTYGNLVGGVDAKMMMGGAVVTDHAHIRAGSIARANGGCLIVFLKDIADYPASLQSLFNSIKNKSLAIKDIASSVGYDSHLPLRPEPIPLNFRVIICGFGDLWHRLHALAKEYDFDFVRYFEVKAEVLPFIEANPKNIALYASWAREFVKVKSLSSVDDSAIGRLVEESMRLSGNRRRLSTDIGTIKRIIIEASERKLSLGDNKNPLSALHIIETLQKRFWRLNFVYEMIQRQISEGKKIINVSGQKVGEMNGLAVSDFGDIEAGSPWKVAVSAYPSAKPSMITIERESELSGKIFNKADFTVRESLKTRYAGRAPLSLGLSFTFEQSYYGMDGDSASLAEFFTIISALSEAPINQGIAITGSMSLHGDVQPIGGVNEKIEGFFDACKAVGEFDGSQGVILPYQNADNLMLRDDVAEAVESGKFGVWPIKTIEEGAEILMGVPLEDLDIDVRVRLREFDEIVKSFSVDDE